MSAGNVALSRRVARLMSARVFQQLPYQERSRLAREVMEAEGLRGALGEETRALILAAEREAAAK